MTWFDAVKQKLIELSATKWELGLLIFIVMFVGTLVLAVVTVVRWPPDKFCAHRAVFWAGRHPALRAAGFALKNMAGVLLLILGLLMSVPGVPGQGLLTIVIGLTLLDFPGKARLECWAIRHPRVLHALNRLRRRFRKPDLEVEPR